MMKKQIHQRDGRNAPLVPSLLVVVVTLLAISGGTYMTLGDLDRAFGRAPVSAKEIPMDEASVRAAIAKLKEQLETHPDSAEGWALLGRTMMALGNYAEALTALKKANELVPDAPGLMLQYADALAMNAGGKLTDEAQDLVKRVLEIEPDNIAALWLAGLGAAERQNNAEALKYLTRARQLSAAAGAPTAELDQVLARLQAAPSQSATPDIAGTGTDSDNAQASTSIPIVVDIDPDYAARLGGDETLFVFARVAGQGGPPVAVRRAQDFNFPYRTSLDQSMSMAPQFRLTTGQSIVVAARLSKTGDAMPTAGDLIGRAAAFDYPDPALTEDAPLTITIDSIQR